MNSSRLTPALARTASAIAITACLMLPGIAAAQDAPVAQAEQTSQDEAATGDDIVVTGIRASARALDRDQAQFRRRRRRDLGRRHRQVPRHQPGRIAAAHHRRVDHPRQRRRLARHGPRLRPRLQPGHAERPPAAVHRVIDAGGDRQCRFARGTGRSFDFHNLASEGVATLEVYKTGRASIPSGGIGATINVVTRRPLDAREDGLSGSIGAKARLRHHGRGCRGRSEQDHARSVRPDQLEERE